MRDLPSGETSSAVERLRLVLLDVSSVLGDLPRAFRAMTNPNTADHGKATGASFAVSGEHCLQEVTTRNDPDQLSFLHDG